MLKKTGGPATAITLLKEFARGRDASRARLGSLGGVGAGDRWLMGGAGGGGYRGKASVVGERTLGSLYASILKEKRARGPGWVRRCCHFLLPAGKWGMHLVVGPQGRE